MFLLLAAVMTLLLSVFAVHGIDGQKGQAGVRFAEKKIDAKQMEHIYEEGELEDLPLLTLWRFEEGAGICKTDGSRHATVKLVELWGDVEQIYTECLMDGAPLSKEDKAGCMLSGKAAFEVFGSEDVVGRQVLYDNRAYEVRGLLDVEDKLFIREEDEGLFSYMEAKGSAGGVIESVRTLLVQAGVSISDGAVLAWDFIRGILHLFMALAIGMLEFAAVRWFAVRHRERSLLVWCVRVCAVLLFAVVLVKGWCFPQEYIPGSWSDFEFYENLFQEQWENYNRYLNIPSIFKDRQIFESLRLAFGCIAVSSLCSVACAIRASRKMKRTTYGKISSSISSKM